MNTSIFKVNEGCDSPRASHKPYTAGFINDHNTDSDSFKQLNSFDSDAGDRVPSIKEE